MISVFAPMMNYNNTLDDPTTTTTTTTTSSVGSSSSSSSKRRRLSQTDGAMLSSVLMSSSSSTTTLCPPTKKRKKNSATINNKNKNNKNDSPGGISTPQPHDVLCGRGGLINKHPGNVAFRRVVDHNKETYHSCKKAYKILLSRSIVEAILRQNPPGRFLEKSKHQNGCWVDIGKTRAIQKTSQALREGADQIRKNMMTTTTTTTTNSSSSSNGKIATIVAPAPSDNKEQLKRPQDDSDNSDNEQVSCSVQVEPDVPPTSGQGSVTKPQQQQQQQQTTLSESGGDSQDQCLGDMDNLDIFCDDSLFAELAAMDYGFPHNGNNNDHHILDPTEPIPVFGLPRQVQLQAYTGVPVVSVLEMQNQQLLPKATTKNDNDNDDNDDERPQPLSSSSSSNDDNVSVVSLESLLDDIESSSSSSSEDDNDNLLDLGDLALTKIWEL